MFQYEVLLGSPDEIQEKLGRNEYLYHFKSYVNSVSMNKWSFLRHVSLQCMQKIIAPINYVTKELLRLLLILVNSITMAT